MVETMLVQRCKDAYESIQKIWHRAPAGVNIICAQQPLIDMTLHDAPGPHIQVHVRSVLVVIAVSNRLSYGWIHQNFCTLVPA